jgi:GT2 family glycosyltransferase
MTLTALIVTWNRRDDLRRLLEDLVRQSDPADEVIVVDNGSDDGTAEVVTRQFPSVLLVPLDRNTGLSFGRNAGIGRASGDLIAVLDNDLRVLDRDFLAKVRASAARHSDCGIISFHCSDGLWDRAAVPAGARLVTLQELEAMAERGQSPVQARAFFDWFFWGGACVIRREVFAAVGAFDVAFRYGGEEWDFALRCHTAGVRLLRDEGLWVVHVRARDMRAPGAEAAKLENMIVALARHLPARDLALILPLQLATAAARAVRHGEVIGFARSLGRLAAHWPRLVAARRRPVSPATAARFFFLRTHQPTDYAEVERATTSALDYYRTRWKGAAGSAPEQPVLVDYRTPQPECAPQPKPANSGHAP